MAWALRINPPLESRGMYLCVFIMREHYRDQRPGHIRTIVQRHAETKKRDPIASSLRLNTQKHSQMHWIVDKMEISVHIVEICCLVLL